MNMPPIPEANLAKLKELHNSEEYRQLCAQQLAACNRLTEVAHRLLENIDAIKDRSESRTIHREYASGSSLHRGFYCPSPVFDVVVGNTRRGKILKRITSRSNPSHEYGFDENGRLLWCRNLHKGMPGQAEYLVYEGNTVYGIALAPDGSLRSISEETYENGRIKAYLFASLLSFGGEFSCSNLDCELYGYDSEGLLTYEMVNTLIPPRQDTVPESMRSFFGNLIPGPLCRRSKYRFRRENGYLVSYTDGEYEYQALAQRKA